MNDLVSIITPTFRRSHDALWRCITSVQRQTYARFEHIVASDGVHEHGAEQLVLGFRDPRVRYVVTERPHRNHGNGVRHEVMMRHATGRWLVFLDDDNIIFPRYLSMMLSALAAGPSEARFAICELLHLGPLPPETGVAPLIMTGEPLPFHIDTLQVMMDADAMREIGWVSDTYHADGTKYAELAERHRFVRVPECLCAHL